jgi:hypothetical protein
MYLTFQCFEYAAHAAGVHIDMSRDTVDSVLRGIASLDVDNAISSSYTDIAESIRQSGAPSNNTLLTIILSEIRRGNDETAKLTNSINKLNESMKSMSSKFIESMESQNEILASMSLSTESAPQPQRNKGKAGAEDWYYLSTKLGSKHHVFACLISQLMGMVQLEMDFKGIQYPNSVDCEFNVMVTMVRVASSAHCKNKSIEYKPPIKLRPVGDQAFDTIYPYISSKAQQDPATLNESTLVKMINPITRDVMQEAEYLRERLCFLEPVLSARQVDILRSIRFPFIVEGRLNYDISKIKPRSSHPDWHEIDRLASKQKETFATARLNGKSINDSHEIASNTAKS